MVGAEVRPIPLANRSLVRTYGTIDGGLELMRLAWQNLKQVFTVRHQPILGIRDPPSLKVFLGSHRMQHTILSKHPVDALIVERGHIQAAPKYHQPSTWFEMVSEAPKPKQPLVIVETWASHVQLWVQGPMSKYETSAWQKLGYESRCQVIHATAVGGAIQQSRLVIARCNYRASFTWTWSPTEGDAQVQRPMDNLLRPPGLIPKRDYATARPSGNIPHSKKDPMPCRKGAWIETDRGTRRIRDDELIRGLGGPKDYYGSPMTEGILRRTTSVFIWEHLSPSLAGVGPTVSNGTRTLRDARQDLDEEEAWEEDPRTTPVKWRPPNLTPSGDWYRARVENLRKATRGLPNAREEFEKGLQDLETHRTNYDKEGPKATTLQLLWWEFPPEHWEELREGSPMNFLSMPEEVIHANAEMTEDGLKAAIEFTEELISLGVLRPGNHIVKTTAPLFVVGKPGQTGQYRVIADMLRGGQNGHIGADPTVLPRVSHIADQLYAGGYSAVVDASKYFYQYRTFPGDYPYLGVKHPRTGELYYYHGLPMGSSQSPASACRKGYGFLRKLRQRHQMFQGQPKGNCWWTGFSGLGYDPSLGYGLAFLNNDGRPCVKVWAFVDDFLIHGPTRELVEQALDHFLDTALEVGMLCHPKKLIAPGQIVRYCGFILDTRNQPVMRIPRPKRERALAITELLLNEPTKRWSRLALSVAAGVLESLVDGTPRRIGHTYLRTTHMTVHPPDAGTGLEAYLGTTHLPAAMIQELKWWRTFLQAGRGRHIRPTSAATFIPTWGDGSGTGTGGTYGPPTHLQMWKGKWSPYVHHFSSNWKELATLLQTMNHLARDPQVDTAGTTVFYFTDNTTTYWVAASGSSPSPELHKLIEEIRHKEVELACHLEVIHVPGVVMVQQGTDALSRGIWISPLHSHLDSREITKAVFDPFPFDGYLVQEYVDMLPACHHSSRKWERRWWDQVWNPQQVFHRLSVWHPPPEIARQVICFVLECWAECPSTTSGLFFIPRTVPAFWRGICRSLIELPTIFPHERTLRVPPVINIPCIVLYLPPHVRSLPTHDRLDRPAYPEQARWHLDQAALLRGLPPRDLDGQEGPGVHFP